MLRARPSDFTVGRARRRISNSCPAAKRVATSKRRTYHLVQGAPERERRVWALASVINAADRLTFEPRSWLEVGNLEINFGILMDR